MIGGGMLLCAVGAMILIAWWSLPRDDEVDPSTGLLALKSPSARTLARKNGKGARRARRPVSSDADADNAAAIDEDEPRKRNRRPDPAKRRRRR